MASLPPAVGDEVLQGFAFHSEFLMRPIEIEQEAGRDIGFKLYPGALLLARYIEETSSSSALFKTVGAVLELGAGICALPGLMLSSRGARVVATDIPEVVSRLASNMDASVDCAGAGHGGSIRAAPLYWGRGVPGEHSCQAVLSAIAAPAVSDGVALPTTPVSRHLDLILGADIVYHEHLIEPLLHTLIDLTEPITSSSLAIPGAGAAAGCAPALAAAESKPPVVILSYVQRFKRAKAFFKLAAQHFEVQAIPTRDVVDYEVLTWTLPRLLAITGESAHPLPPAAPATLYTAAAAAADARAATGAVDAAAAAGGAPGTAAARSAVRPLLNSMSCDFEAMLPLLRRAAAVVRANRLAATVAAAPSAADCGSGSASASRGRAGSTDSTRSGRDLTDDGSVDPFTALRAGDVYRTTDTSAVAAAPVDSVAALSVRASAEAARAEMPRPHFGEGAAGTDRAVVAEADALCAELGLPPLVPSRAYIYIMTRRPSKPLAVASGAGASKKSAAAAPRATKE